MKIKCIEKDQAATAAKIIAFHRFRLLGLVSLYTEVKLNSTKKPCPSLIK